MGKSNSSISLGKGKPSKSKPPNRVSGDSDDEKANLDRTPSLEPIRPKSRAGKIVKNKVDNRKFESESDSASNGKFSDT